MKIFVRGYLLLTAAFAAIFSLVLLAFPSQAAALSSEFGVIGAVPSLSSDSSKQAAVDKIANAGFGWMRHEFHYANPMSFEHYDAANSKAKAKGIKTLGLLAYPGSGKSHDDWKNYVQSVVSHYGTDISAWEIMNEADNYLSASDYVTYLKEAHAIIKGINPNATVVLTGITSRPETPNFWNGVAAAGGWGYFDVAGLHVYHAGNPEKVNFGGGDLIAEYDRAVASLKKNGGGKKIWITETGYKTSEVGNENQANYLARTLIMSKSISTIEKIFIYRLYDDSSETYGLTGADLSERTSYSRVKELISQLGGAGIGTRLYPQSKQVLDTLDTIQGWSAAQSSNASVALTSVAGNNGNALKIAYTFNADQAYGLVEKSIPVSGAPEAFGAWFYGDDTKNVWKFRFKDARGETFQTDLGNLVSGWNYKQFTIATDAAMVSWDGDGKVDYPVSFNSFVVDRQGGDASASAMVDDLVAVTGGADLFAFQFGSKVAYWKASGSATASLCGAHRNFSESPAYASGVDCSDAPKTPVAASTSAKKTTTTAAPTVKPVIDASKSVFRIDGANVPPDGVAAYRIVILLKDSAGTIIKTLQPSVKIDGDQASLKIGEVVLVGDEWWATVASSLPGDRVVTILVDGKELTKLTMSYVTVSSTPIPTAGPLETTFDIKVLPWHQTKAVMISILAVVELVLSGLLYFLYRRRKRRQLLTHNLPDANRNYFVSLFKR